MDKNPGRIEIKRGYGSFYNKTNHPNIATVARFERPYDFELYGTTHEENYLLYTLDFINQMNQHNKSKSFKMIIHKSETDIIDLLDSANYSNFLIAKALIKQKLKEYGKNNCSMERS